MVALSASAAIFENVLRDEQGNFTFYRFVDGYTFTQAHSDDGQFHGLGHVAVMIYLLDPPMEEDFKGRIKIRVIADRESPPRELYEQEVPYTIMAGATYAVLDLTLSTLALPLFPSYRIDLVDSEYGALTQIPVPVTIR